MNTNLNLNNLKIQQYEKTAKNRKKTRLLTRSVRHSGTDNDWLQLNNYNVFKRNFELEE